MMLHPLVVWAAVQVAIALAIGLGLWLAMKRTGR